MHVKTRTRNYKGEGSVTTRTPGLITAVDSRHCTKIGISFRGAISFDLLRNGVSKIGEESRKRYCVIETRRLRGTSMKSARRQPDFSLSILLFYRRTEDDKATTSTRASAIFIHAYPRAKRDIFTPARLTVCVSQNLKVHPGLLNAFTFAGKACTSNKQIGNKK